MLQSSQIRQSSESSILKRILENYDKNTKPSTGNSTIVKVNILVRKIINICSKNQEITVQLTLRQKYNDPRLNFQRESALIYIPITDANLIWQPDLFFSNGLESKIHNDLKPNQLVRIYSTGDVLLSTRITATLSCPMNFRRFPFDTQQCNLMIASCKFK